MRFPHRSASLAASFVLSLALVASCSDAPPDHVSTISVPAVVKEPARPDRVRREERTESSGWTQGTLARSGSLRRAEAHLASMRLDETQVIVDPRTPDEVLAAYQVSAEYADTDPIGELTSDLAGLEKRISLLHTRLDRYTRELESVRENSGRARELERELHAVELELARHTKQTGILREALALSRRS